MFNIERDEGYNRLHVFVGAPGQFSICLTDEKLKLLQKTIKEYRNKRKYAADV